MSEYKKENDRENQSENHLERDENTGMQEGETLADYAARKIGYKKGKLPKDWCRVIFSS